MVHACNEDDAQTIYDNMKTGQGNTADFDAVKQSLPEKLRLSRHHPQGRWWLLNSADEVY
jgi:hypothetical protein